MQTMNFGRIEAVRVADGQPVLDPPPRVIREVKLGASTGARAELSLADFVLKAEVRELFTELATVGDGVIDSIEVRHGLPFRLITSQPPQPEGGVS
ncbi:MAG TPA: hypothetical protein P5572_12295 [Phycisphaerae bacterium]|nr:hypothetical protein [Phycisphaerae bacterium]